MSATATAVSETAGSATASLRAYDPAYDPLVSPTPGHGTDYAPTYWIGTAGAPPEDDGPVVAERGELPAARRPAGACPGRA